MPDVLSLVMATPQKLTIQRNRHRRYTVRSAWLSKGNWQEGMRLCSLSFSFQTHKSD